MRESPAAAEQAAGHASQAELLWYDRPALDWTEALPIGNGRLGAMVFGGVETEHLQLNDDTLWSGWPGQDVPRPEPGVLPALRRLIMVERRFAEADALARRFQGSFSESYLPLGDLFVACAPAGPIAGYRRELDLASAEVRVSYTAGGLRFTRVMFASAVHQVVVVRLTCSAAGQITCLARLRSALPATALPVGGQAFAMRGKAPAHVVPHHLESAQPLLYDEAEGHGMRFEARVMALAEGGTVSAGPDGVQVERATALTLLVAAATGYRGFDRLPDLPAAPIGAAVERTLAAAAECPFEELRAAHLAEYGRRYGTLTLHLGQTPAAARPTDERLRAADLAQDPHLAALYVQYGRYLLIASSRPGTQPANLQGIWNDQVRPIWGSDWTININLQMNYWLAEVANLAACHEPLGDLIAGLAVNGRRAAALTYGCRGWAAHNGTDLWRPAHSGGEGVSPPDWTMWPMGGVWLCQHLWEHYLFGAGPAYLRDHAYPLMRGAAEFCLDWLVGDRAGHLVTCPSTSPENQFMAPDGRPAAVAVAATMDMMLIGELFGACSAAGSLMGVDAPFHAELEAARARLLPPRVGRDGRLQEWAEDFPEVEPGHRHISHLYGVHPGCQITSRSTPDLARAARRSLEYRLTSGGGHTEWSRAWTINQWARLGEGDLAHQHFLALLSSATLPNLLAAHAPLENDGRPGLFQIDGNFGGAAGVLEMLLHSHGGLLDLLPALPRAWPTGTVRGLRARGGLTVDLAWTDSRLDEAVLVPDGDGPCRVTYGPAPLAVSGDGQATVISAPGGRVLHLITRRGRAVVLRPAPRTMV